MGRFRTIEQIKQDMTPGPWSYESGSVHATPKADHSWRPGMKNPAKQPIITRTDSDADPCQRDANMELASLAPGMLDACIALIKTINFTGGVVFVDGLAAPVADPDWIDLGGAYITACDALGIEPIIAEED